MIVLTGAGGFIGSVMLKYLNDRGIDDIAVVDDLPNEHQYKNLLDKKFKCLLSTTDSLDDLNDISAVIHIGADSNTLTKNWSSIYKQNVLSTRNLYKFSKQKSAKFIFTSSAAVYGKGGKPANQYAFSKMISERELEDACILRLFNVYGPNEYHKGRMASTILHWHDQLCANGKLSIFKNSHSFCRDFIYVNDVVSTIYYLLENFKSGIYELGSGQSRTFEEVADLCIKYKGIGSKQYIEMPLDLVDQYQTYTCADIENLKNLGVKTHEFLSIEEGIRQYFSYLDHKTYI